MRTQPNHFPSHRVAHCDNIQKLRFQTHNVGLVAIGNMHSEHLLAIEQYVPLEINEKFNS